MEYLVIFNDEVTRFAYEEQARDLYELKKEEADKYDLLKIYKEIEA